MPDLDDLDDIMDQVDAELNGGVDEIEKQKKEFLPVVSARWGLNHGWGVNDDIFVEVSVIDVAGEVVMQKGYDITPAYDGINPQRIKNDLRVNEKLDAPDEFVQIQRTDDPDCVDLQKFTVSKQDYTELANLGENLAKLELRVVIVGLDAAILKTKGKSRA